MQRKSKIVMRFCSGRLEGHRPAIARDRVIVPALLLERIPEVVMCSGIMWSRCNGAAEEVLGFLVSLSTSSGDAEIMQCPAMAGIGSQHPAKQHLGLLQPPRPVMLQRFGEIRVIGRRWMRP